MAMSYIFQVRVGTLIASLGLIKLLPESWNTGVGTCKRWWVVYLQTHQESSLQNLTHYQCSTATFLWSNAIRFLRANCTNYCCNILVVRCTQVCWVAEFIARVGNIESYRRLYTSHAWSWHSMSMSGRSKVWDNWFIFCSKTLVSCLYTDQKSFFNFFDG